MILALTLASGATIAPRYANRHVLISGATGGGKSVTLTRLASQFCAAGTPVLIFDAKGDLDGFPCRMRIPGPGLPGSPETAFRLDLAAMGADLVARMLDLSPAQAGALDVVYAHEAPHTAVELALAVQRAAARGEGHVTAATAATIGRAVLRVPTGLMGPDGFDALSCLGTGATVISAVTLARSPEVYAATVAHVLDQLFTRLPERGDLPAPRLALMVDEAHLLFADAPARVARQLEQIVRLIRSKGVALVFATQAPSDLPDVILGQLATRIQHAMRSATLRDAKAVRAAAETMPAPPGFDAAAAIGRLRPGEALVSLVGPDGQAQPCSVVKIALPGPFPYPVAAPVVRPVGLPPDLRHPGDRMSVDPAQAILDAFAPVGRVLLWALIVAAVVAAVIVLAGFALAAVLGAFVVFGAPGAGHRHRHRGHHRRH